MRKNSFLFFIIALSVLLTGCVTAKKVVRERVDQEISGNQGYLQGACESPAIAGPTTREYIDIKVEVPTWDEVKEALKKEKPKGSSTDKSISGNRGYITSSKGKEEELPVAYQSRLKRVVEEEMAEEEPAAEKEEVSRPAPKEYKVKKGDTLSGIAKALYGKASKWTLIYEANSDKIKNPSSIKAGTVLIIPDLNTEKESQPRYVK